MIYLTPLLGILIGEMLYRLSKPTVLKQPLLENYEIEFFEY